MMVRADELNRELDGGRMEIKGGIRNRCVNAGGPDRDAGDHRWPGRQRARRKKIDDLVDDETTVNPKLPSTGERGENGARYLADPRLQGRTVADPWGDMGGDRVRDRIRSEERRVGEGGVSPCRSRGWPYP